MGYYSRARNLLNLAKQVAALKSPPRTAAEWREFKGVGPYTAAAIASPDRAAAKRAFEAMMTMGKIDIAAIEAAIRG